MNALTTERWAEQPLVPIHGCEQHGGFPTSYCTRCRALFDKANPTWTGPYPDEVVTTEIGALQAEVERLQRRNRILSDDLARLLSAAASVQSQIDRDAALEIDLRTWPT